MSAPTDRETAGLEPRRSVTAIVRTYYLQTNGGWYLWDAGRWQFLAGRPDARLALLLGHNSDILLVTRLTPTESALLHTATTQLQFHPGQPWTMYWEEK